MSLTSIHLRSLRTCSRLANSTPCFTRLSYSTPRNPNARVSLRVFARNIHNRPRESHGSKRAIPTTRPDPIEPPPRVKGWPTPWISEQDHKSFIIPLYKHDWCISFGSKHGSGFIAATGKRMVSPSLTKQYNFRGMDDTISFLTKVSELSKAEKHDISYTYEPKGPKGSSIIVKIGTHSAKRPPWLEEGTSPELIGLTEIPGITKRDVRFAILLDKIFQEHRLSRSTSDSAPTAAPSPSHPLSTALRFQQLDWAVLVWQTRHRLGYKTCLHCGEKHGRDVLFCTNRYSLPSPAKFRAGKLQPLDSEPCVHCASPKHWSLDCPELITAGRQSCDYCLEKEGYSSRSWQGHTILDCPHTGKDTVSGGFTERHRPPRSRNQRGTPRDEYET